MNRSKKKNGTLVNKIFVKNLKFSSNNNVIICDIILLFSLIFLNF